MKRILKLIVLLGVAAAALSACSKADYGDITVHNETGYNFTRCTFSFVKAKSSESIVSCPELGSFSDKGSIVVPQSSRFFHLSGYTEDGYFVLTYDVKAMDGMTLKKSDIRIVTRSE